MTESTKQIFYLSDYIDQEIDEYFGDDEEQPSDEKKSMVSYTITKYIAEEISNQINNAFF